MVVCKEYEARISALIDDELGARERIEVLEHIAQCPACKAYWEDLLSVRDALRAPEQTVPAGFADAVMARVRETAQEKTSDKKMLRSPQWKRFAALAACCAVVVLGIWAADIAPEVGIDDMAMCATNGSAAPEMYAAQDENSDTGMTNEAAADYGISDSDDAAAYDAMPGSVEDPDNAKSYAENPDFTAAMLTDSDLAEQWVEDTLGEEWVSGASYALSEEQYQDLREMLEQSGEMFTEIMGDQSRSEYRLLAE